MSTNAENLTELTEDRESGLLHRTFQAEVSAGEGRTVDVRIVPYGEEALVDDGRGPYRESWVMGAFDGQGDAAHRVILKYRHREAITDIVGKGTALLEREDGLYGSFRVFDDAAGDKALLLIREGVLPAVSLEAKPKKSLRMPDGLVKRVKAHLAAVALCPQGAYESALVLAIREQPESMIDAALLPNDIDPELVARCQRLGIQVPQRYEAHPDETDTSAETDTSESGTGQTPETESQEVSAP